MTTPAHNSPDDLLTVFEVLDLLKVSRVTVQKWCREGKLPAVKLGKEYRIRRKDLETWYDRLLAGQHPRKLRHHPATLLLYLLFCLLTTLFPFTTLYIIVLYWAVY